MKGFEPFFPLHESGEITIYSTLALVTEGLNAISKTTIGQILSSQLIMWIRYTNKLNWCAWELSAKDIYCNITSPYRHIHAVITSDLPLTIGLTVIGVPAIDI